MFLLLISNLILLLREHILYNYIFMCVYFFGCVGSSLLRTGFLQLQRAGATLWCGAQASHCRGFSCCRAGALGTRPSEVMARGLSSFGSRALEHRLSSCDAWAQLLRSMWDLPRPGLEPVSPALASGFLTPVPPGKSSIIIILLRFIFQPRICSISIECVRYQEYQNR